MRLADWEDETMRWESLRSIPTTVPEPDQEYGHIWTRDGKETHGFPTYTRPVYVKTRSGNLKDN